MLNEFLNFRMIFLSIIIEALPFILVGVIISALIENFVSEDFIRRILPKNKLLGLLPASLVGLMFPVCECGVVPITGRLVQKGLPLPVAVSFMLASPVINPVVAASTAAAFNGSWQVAAYRLGLAFIVTVLVSLGIGLMFSDSQCKNSISAFAHDETAGTIAYKPHKFISTLKDSANEFFDMGKYLIAGSFLSALAQTFISYSSIASIGQDAFSSIAAMMAFAFGISVCSTSDAFIAASFSGTFTFGSLLAFMILGPMVDLKNSAMLLKAFTPRFVFTLITLTLVLCGTVSYIVNLMLLEVL